jgi:hypothetical protein
VISLGWRLNITFFNELGGIYCTMPVINGGKGGILVQVGLLGWKVTSLPSLSFLHTVLAPMGGVIFYRVKMWRNTISFAVNLRLPKRVIPISNNSFVNN